MKNVYLTYFGFVMIFISCSEEEFKDTEGPQVVSYQPANNSEKIEVWATPIAIFNEEIDPISVSENSFKVTGNGKTILGHYEVEGEKITLFPGNGFEGETEYTVQLNDGITDLAGNGLETVVTWKFVTADVTSPMVIDYGPNENQLNVEPSADIFITFSEPLDPSTVNNTSIQVLNGSQLVSGIINLGGNTVTFLPDAELAGETVYTVSITDQVTDLSGNTFGSFNWSFTTRETVRPTVNYTSPCQSCRIVEITSNIEAFFSESLKASTVTSESFKLVGPDGEVPGTVTYSEDPTNRIYKATLTPNAPLKEFESEYSIIFTEAITDHFGNTLLGTTAERKFKTYFTDPNYYYRIICMWKGDDFSLDTYYDSNTGSYPLFFGTTGGYTGQFWTITETPTSRNFVFKNNYGGSTRALTAYKNEVGYLSRYFSPPTWKITATGAGWYRLTRNGSVNESFDGYALDGTVLSPVANYTGQYWRFVRIGPIN